METNINNTKIDLEYEEIKLKEEEHKVKIKRDFSKAHFIFSVALVVIGVPVLTYLYNSKK